LKRSAITFGREDGQAVILVVVAMSILLIGAVGLAIDGGQMYAQRQMAQAAVDAAAQAGIMSIFNGSNATSAHPFGTGTLPGSSTCTTADLRTPCVYARNNGFGGTPADTVTLSFPVTVSGVTLSSATVPAFAVTVQRTLQTGLIRFVGAPATVSITAKATAGLVGTVSPYSIYALDRSSAQNAFLATGGARVALGGGAIVVNSTNNDAATVSGSSVVTASAISVAGGVVISGGGITTPAPVTGAAPAVDPFASAPAPVIGACAYTSYSKGSGTWTLNPGVYCGGISLHNGAIATFNPGTYIINGGGLSLAGGTTTGSGVIVYLKGTTASPSFVTISNGGSVTFSALASGLYMGILFFQDKSNAANVTFSGGAAMKLTGTLYFPATTVSFSNGSNTASDMAIVANRVSFTGGTNTITYDPTGLKTGLFVKSVALVQ
jgi:hypothetical protein